MDNKKYNQALMEQLTLLRDLLIVIERGGEKSPDVLYSLAIEKSQLITSMVQSWREEINPEAIAVPEEYAQWLDEDNQDDIAAEVASGTQPMPSEEHAATVADDANEVTCSPAADDAVPQQENQVDKPIEETTTFFFKPATDTTPLQQLPHEENEIPVSDNEIIVTDIENDNDIIPLSDSGEMPACGAEKEAVEEIKQPDEASDYVIEPEGVVVDEEIELTDGYIEIEKDDKYEIAVAEPEDDWYNRGQSAADESTTMTIGDKMSLHRAKELRKALTFNERFRFRRELFGNKDVEMNNTLNLIDAMSDYTEACDYLLQDLGWSADEPVVQEFLELVARHFKQQ